MGEVSCKKEQFFRLRKKHGNTDVQANMDSE